MVLIITPVTHFLPQLFKKRARMMSLAHSSRPQTTLYPFSIDIFLTTALLLCVNMSICSTFRAIIPPWRHNKKRFRYWVSLHSKRDLSYKHNPISSSFNDDSVPPPKSNQSHYDPSEDLFAFAADLQPRKNVISGGSTLRSWFGPNGQYIRELPCPSCRGRGYTSCTECGIERSRLDCSKCNGKGMKTCHQCSGDCVIWEESIDERPWERARSISPVKVKEDDEVDSLEIKPAKRSNSKRVYGSLPPEVRLKISRSLKSLNARSGLFSKRMKIIHSDPTLRAERIAAIKRSKGTPEARKHASESMKAFFLDPENRRKRSISMKGVRFYCNHCGREGHRKHYCPELLQDNLIERGSRCRLCGERGHNKRTCQNSKLDISGSNITLHSCKICGQVGHNSRTCRQKTGIDKAVSATTRVSLIGSKMRTYSCKLCLEKGHNVRTCTRNRPPDDKHDM